MKRTTVYLDEIMDIELARLARLEGRSKAELIREVLAEYIGSRRKASAVPDWVGMVSSGSGDLAERDEEVLAKLINEKHERILADHEQWQRDKDKDQNKDKVQ